MWAQSQHAYASPAAAAAGYHATGSGALQSCSGHVELAGTAPRERACVEQRLMVRAHGRAWESGVALEAPGCDSKAHAEVDVTSTEGLGQVCTQRLDKELLESIVRLSGTGSRTGLPPGSMQGAIRLVV